MKVDVRDGVVHQADADMDGRHRVLNSEWRSRRHDGTGRCGHGWATQGVRMKIDVRDGVVHQADADMDVPQEPQNEG